MQTDLKLLDPAVIRAQIAHHLDSQLIRYSYAQALKRALLAYGGKTANVRLKSVIEAEIAKLDNRDGLMTAQKALNFNHCYAMYTNGEHLGRPVFRAEITWYERDPDPDRRLDAESRKHATTRQGVSVSYMPRVFDENDVAQAFVGYDNILEARERLVLKTNWLDEAVETYNAALDAFIDASRFGDAYPISLFMPYNSAKL